MAVCKRWKWICENSKTVTKYLNIPLDPNQQEVILWIKKHQPSMLSIDMETLATHCLLLDLVVATSESFKTLIVKNAELCFRNHRDPMNPIAHITTVALDGSLSLAEVFDLFPNVERLQVDCLNSLDNTYISKLKELAIVEAENYSETEYSSINIPKFTVISPKHFKVAQKIYGTWQEIPVETLSYVEFYRYFGVTRLKVALCNRNINLATELLTTQTTMEYDQYLNNRLPYKYPTRLNVSQYPEHYEVLLRSDEGYNEIAYYFLEKFSISMNPTYKFLTLAKLQRFKEALELLPKVNGFGVLTSLFAIVQSPTIQIEDLKKPEILQAGAKILQSHSNTFYVYSVSLFEKLKIFNIDWSLVDTNYYNARIFVEMARAGCRVALPKTDKLIDNLIYEVNEIDPGVAFEMLRVRTMDLQIRKDLFSKLKIAIITEKDGESLLNARIALDYDLFESSYAEYINHMDSRGYTPLMSAIEEANLTAVCKLLRLGADPNLYRGDQLSALAAALVNRRGKMDIWSAFSIIKELLHNKADVNAPCLYEERMCSPLMIAVKAGCEDNIYLLLLVHGARADYADETGQTILDFASADVLDCLRRWKEI